MKVNPPHKNTQNTPHDPIIERKHSLLKPPLFHIAGQIELPRFYSSDEKIKRKNVIIQTEHRLPASPHQPTPQSKDNTKRAGLKCAKTEKNETPSKAAGHLNKVKIIQQKLEEALLKGQYSDNRSKIKQKKTEFHEILQTEKNEGQILKETTESTTEPSHNKIRYKIQKKGDETKNHKKAAEGLEIETGPMKLDPPKTVREIVRESKAQTEECLKNPLKDRSKVVLKNEQATEIVLDKKQQQLKKEQKLRTVSTFESIMKSKGKLSQLERDHLKFIQDVLKKTIKNPGCLDYPQTYIVCDKLKFERKYYQHLEPKHQGQYKSSLILTRLAFYLCAYYILQSFPTKSLLTLFNKTLEAHEIIMSLLIEGEQKPTKDKYFSVNKYSTKDLPRKDSKHQPSQIAVETRGSTLPRINDSIKRQLQGFFSAKDCAHSELFLRVLSQQEAATLQNLSEIDKQLKWEVLKMPTSPFLPVPHPKHKHYLILDLDETLIHFNPNKETCQIRPYASEFLQNLSRYYQLTVFTAATMEYANDIINQIDHGSFISHRLYRNHLTFLMGESLKDISMLGRHLPVTLIVDNLEANFRLHPDNGILIKSWYGAENDSILPKLQNLLIRIVLEFPDDLRKGVSLYANYIAREITERVRGVKIKYEI